jgi:hypothetical protein
MKKLFICLVISLILAGCQNDPGVDMDKFIGKWLFNENNNAIALFEFIDSSHLTFYKSYYGWTAEGTYSFTDETISFELKIDGDEEPYSLNYKYLFYNDGIRFVLSRLPDASDPIDPLGMVGGSFYKQQ